MQQPEQSTLNTGAGFNSWHLCSSLSIAWCNHRDGVVSGHLWVCPKIKKLHTRKEPTKVGQKFSYTHLKHIIAMSMGHVLHLLSFTLPPTALWQTGRQTGARGSAGSVTWQVPPPLTISLALALGKALCLGSTLVWTMASDSPLSTAKTDLWGPLDVAQTNKNREKMIWVQRLKKKNPDQE